MKRMLFPNPNMLLRIAQGDAYGLRTEYLQLPRDKELQDSALEFRSYGEHPIHSLAPGQYSDDTQMSIAVAEALLEPVMLQATRVQSLQASRDFVAYRFAASFLRAFKRDPRDGYARGFHAFLEKTNTTEEFLANIKSDSDRNGAAMRAVPLGVIQEPMVVASLASQQAAITHNTPGGRRSAEIVALASHYAMYEPDPLADLRPFVLKHVWSWPKDPVEPWPGTPVGPGEGVGMATARAVLTLLETQSTLLDIAKTAILWGGDTDSVISIAWGIASARMKDKLPDFFDKDLEDNAYGRGFLLRLGEQLMESRLELSY